MQGGARRGAVLAVVRHAYPRRPSELPRRRQPGMLEAAAPCLADRRYIAQGVGVDVAQIGRPTFRTLKTDALYYGDNLFILREYIPKETVDLVYLDPPFNSNQDYNIIFKDESGRRSDAQQVAFEDTWHWGPKAERTYYFLTNSSEHGGRIPESVSAIVAALVTAMGRNQMTAYLVEMSVRLVELHRTLKSTGSLYLHCDPTASHYLKMLLDAVFGPAMFRNEIVWKRSHAHSDSKQGRKGYGNVADVLLYYTKTNDYTFNTKFLPYEQSYVDKYYRYKDEDGRRYWLDNLTGPGGAAKGNPYYEVMGVSRHWRYSRQRMEELVQQKRVVQSKPGNVPQYKRYLDEMPGVPLQNIWSDINPINMMAKERIGYPTQKPLALLKRIIEVSTNPGDLVLDPFCGCGTAVAAAHELDRRWVGIDVTYLAIWVMRSRLQKNYGLTGVEVVNEPTEVEGVRQMALEQEGRYQFQWWALEKLGAAPPGGEKKKGADSGIDGKITFTTPNGTMGTVLVSVKSGRVDPSMVRDLRGTVERERAAMSIFVTLEEPTAAMRAEATSAGFYQSGTWTFPKLQIVTAAQLLAGDQAVNLPQFTLPPFPAYSGQLPLFR